MLRLADRGFRTNNPSYRKQVFRVSRWGKSVVLIKIVDPKFAPIYHKNLKAMEICQVHGINAPRLLEQDTHNLQFWVTDVGNDITEFDFEVATELLFLGFQAMRDFNGTNKRRQTFSVPIYFQNLRDCLKSFQDKADFPLGADLLQIVDQTMAKIPLVDVGYGVDDPVASNFCWNGDVVSMIDFDNLQDDLNFHYMAGFAVGDLFRNFNQKFTAGILLEFFSKAGYQLDFVESKLFLLGAAARFSTMLVDDIRNKTQTFQPWTTELQSLKVELLAA